jgi:uncharacterized protein (DUF169 family)
MTTDYADLAARLQTGLELDFPPVALTRVSAAPEGIAVATAAVPSACTFWRRAELGVFFAGAQSHMACPIGAMVMGFELDEAKSAELMSLVGEMCAIAYLDEAEVAQIPHFDPPTGGVVYGPLADFPLTPDAVLIWTTPRQAMLLEESLGTTQWHGIGGSILGRPACAALPRAVADGSATLSVGCAGMRTFTEIPDAYTLSAIPEAQLGSLEQALETTLEANTRMLAAYREMKAAV